MERLNPAANDDTHSHLCDCMDILGDCCAVGYY